VHYSAASPQASQPSLFVHLAAGRLAARLTPYAILLIMQRKHGLQVMVNQESLDSVTEFFALPPPSLLPVVEDIFCPAALQLLREHMEPFKDNEPALLEQALVSLGQGRAVNLWPEGPLEQSAYWVPDTLMQEFGPWLKQQFQFKREYREDADARLQAVREAARGDKEVMFVGLHVRRTDYVEFSKNVLGKRVAGKAFYMEAMDYFEEEYPEYQVCDKSDFLTKSDFLCRCTSWR
jgi:hypothetical protein